MSTDKPDEPPVSKDEWPSGDVYIDQGRKDWRDIPLTDSPEPPVPPEPSSERDDS